MDAKRRVEPSGDVSLRVPVAWMVLEVTVADGMRCGLTCGKGGLEMWRFCVDVNGTARTDAE